MAEHRARPIEVGGGLSYCESEGAVDPQLERIELFCSGSERRCGKGLHERGCLHFGLHDRFGSRVGFCMDRLGFSMKDLGGMEFYS